MDLCPNNHGMTPTNTFKDARGTRRCRECSRERQRRYSQKLREAYARMQDLEQIDPESVPTPFDR